MRKLVSCGLLTWALLSLLGGCRSVDPVPPPPASGARTGTPAPYPPNPSMVPPTASPTNSPAMQGGSWISGPGVR